VKQNDGENPGRDAGEQRTGTRYEVRGTRNEG
jgi:hypothetical protein